MALVNKEVKYQRWGDFLQSQIKEVVKLNINRRIMAEIFFILASFVVGRILVFDMANPFILAYISSFLLRGNKFYIASLLGAMGIFTMFRQEFSLKYLLAILILCAVNVFATFRPRAREEVAGFIQAALAAAASLIAGFVLFFLRGGGTYEIITNLLTAGLTLALGIVISKGMGTILPNTKKGIIKNEELLSILVVASVLLLGVADVHIWLFSLRYAVVFLMVLLAAQSGGAAVGATAGVFFGFLLNITGFEYIFFAILLAVVGFGAGVVRFYGRLFSILVFVATFIFATLYFDITLISTSTLLSLTLAAVIFTILPKSFLLNIHTNLNPGVATYQEDYLENIKNQAVQKMQHTAKGYSKLAQIFEKRISPKDNQREMINGDKLVADVKNNLCKTCSNFDECWRHREDELWISIEAILSKVEKRGFMSKEHVPRDFYDICIQVDEFSNCMARAIEAAKTSIEWEKKVAEVKSTIHQQFLGLSHVMSEFATEISYIVNFQKEAENKILKKLTEEKIEVDGLIVIENSSGKYEVSLSKKGRFASDGGHLKEIKNIISNVLKRDIELVEEKQEKGTASLRYVEKQRFYIQSGVAKMNKDNSKESGDSFSLLHLKNGYFVAMVSDGMGSGSKAKEGSEETVELLEELLEKGFKKDIAVKLTNSALLLKSNDEFFSTLDICSIDLNTGLSEFAKIGASTSYLLRDGKVETIGSCSLPVGILENIEIDTCERYLFQDDIIVMATDGVSDSIKANLGGDRWLISLLEEMSIKNPQDIADYVLEEARRNYGHYIKDDMTVVAMRVLDRG